MTSFEDTIQDNIDDDQTGCLTKEEFKEICGMQGVDPVDYVVDEDGEIVPK